MKRYFKLIGIPFIVAVGIFLFIKFVWLKGFDFKEMTVNQYVEFYNSNGEGIIYVTKDDAVMKNEFEKVIGRNFEDKKIDVYRLNLSKSDDDEEQKFINVNNYSDKQFVIPMLIYIKNGEIIQVIEGYVPDYRMIEFITNNNIE